jgi:hypothetical protein
MSQMSQWKKETSKHAKIFLVTMGNGLIVMVLHMIVTGMGRTVITVLLMAPAIQITVSQLIRRAVLAAEVAL